LSLAAHGECVLVGRGAAQLLPPETTLRVRLVGTREDRIANLAQRVSLSPEDAAHRVDALEQDRVRFVVDHFGKDPRDPAQYDLVLNTSRFMALDCAELILEGLRRLQVRLAAKSPEPVRAGSE
jgi:cytidylate kinase